MSRNVWEDNIKLNLREVVCENGDWYGLFQFRLER
jgi:hypothetical protein